MRIVLLFIFVLFGCSSQSSKELESYSGDSVISSIDNNLFDKQNQKEGVISLEKQGSSQNNIQEFILQRLEQHQCDEFIEAINKKGIYVHTDGTIHEELWEEINY